MSKISLKQEIIVWMLMGFFMIVASWATYVAKSEESKRIELEAENVALKEVLIGTCGILDIIAAKKNYSNELTKYIKLVFNIPDSLLAVPPIDSSEVTR